CPESARRVGAPPQGCGGRTQATTGSGQSRLMTTTQENKLHAYEVRDPARLIADIAERARLVEGTAHLALVRDVSTEQKLLRVDTLRLPAEIIDWQEGREELRRVV